MNAAVALLVLALFWFLLRPVLLGGATLAAKALVSVFVLVGVGGLYGSIRLLTRPVTLLSVYDNGLMFHRGPRGYGSGDHFVRWRDVAGIDAGTRERLDEQGAVTIPTIVVTLTGDAPPPPKHLVEPLTPEPVRLHVDLLFGGRGGNQVLQRLQHWRDRSGESQ